MRRAVLVLLAACGVFWAMADPHGLARSAQTAGTNGADATSGLVASVVTYMRELE